MLPGAELRAGGWRLHYYLALFLLPQLAWFLGGGGGRLVGMCHSCSLDGAELLTHCVSRTSTPRSHGSTALHSSTLCRDPNKWLCTAHATNTEMYLANSTQHLH